jgi:large subunit ribosomal protein L25
MSFSVDRHQFSLQFERGSRMFELEAGDKTQVCLLKDVQYNALGDVLFHADFWRIDDQTPVTVNVAVEFIGQPDPVSGAVVDYVGRDIQITCLPRVIPAHVEVEIGQLKVGEHVEAKDIKLPEGASHKDPHRTLVSFHYKHVSTEVAPSEEGAEPVVLTERRPPAGEV